MFWRLFLPTTVLVLAPLALVAGAIALRVEDTALANALLGVVAAAAVGSVAWALLFCIHYSRRTTQPVRELTEAARRICQGEQSPHVSLDAVGEVAVLGQTFNNMSDHLADRIARLEEDRQQLRTILSGMVEGVVALDAEQRILFVNDRATQLLELTAHNPVGRRLWEVVRLRALLDVVQHALAHPEPSQQEITWPGAAPRSLTVHAARLPGTPPRGAVLVLHDTSELRRLERLRQDFVANVSHELKTPLSVIKACVETLLLGAVDDAQHRGVFLERIAEQGDRLYALILDLLSLARIESGGELFAPVEVPVATAVQACLERHRARAESRHQSLTMAGPKPHKAENWDADRFLVERAPPENGLRPLFQPDLTTQPPDDGVAVWVDEEAFDQILDNLVDNALKYTPDGGRIHVAWQPEGESVCLEVTDTGIGIPEQDLARIFERFYRVDKARSREMGGTGLGLSIVKHLVQAMHGSVGATSRVGEGTTFAVRLPQPPRG
jgi:two-component system phosphate regulon sensor histidine kinase PhoR